MLVDVSPICARKPCREYQVFLGKQNSEFRDRFWESLSTHADDLYYRFAEQFLAGRAASPVSSAA
jgi:hypothetical protein